MTDAVTFPLDSFRDAAPHLRRPFTTAAVKFKVQATWPKQNPTGGLIVAYIDARLVVERLNLIVPHLWHDEYQHDGQQLICRLTVDGISRRDVGDGVGKGLYSDALKRAAVKFGIGVPLYAVPKMMLNVSDGHLKPRKDSLELTAAGEQRVRAIYDTWLADHGTQAFGEPLDHGDSPDAQGDAEIEPAPQGDEPTPPAKDNREGDASEQPRVQLVTTDDIAQIRDAGSGLTNKQLRGAFGAKGLDFDLGLTAIPREKAVELVKALSAIARDDTETAEAEAVPA